MELLEKVARAILTARMSPYPQDEAWLDASWPLYKAEAQAALAIPEIRDALDMVRVFSELSHSRFAVVERDSGGRLLLAHAVTANEGDTITIPSFAGITLD